MLIPKSVNWCGDSVPPDQVTSVTPSVTVSPNTSTGSGNSPSLTAIFQPGSTSGATFATPAGI